MKILFEYIYYLIAYIAKVFFKKKIIAIKHSSPLKKQKKWGDYNVACDLSNAINHNKKYFAFPVPVEIWYGAYNKFVDVTILFRGLVEYNPYKTHTNIMYCFSHYEDIKKEEYERYNIVYTLYSTLAKEHGIKLLHAFTNTNFYYPIQSTNKKYEHEVLFIGNSRNIYRNSVKYCVENNIEISVYGSGWEKYIDKKYIKGQVISNDKVKYYYSNSKIILADHWEDMKNCGAISNRVYNIAACKGFCICDKVKNLDKTFEDSVPAYNSEKEFLNLINYYLTHEEERKKLAQKAHDIVVNRYTALQAANLIIKDIENLNT